MIHLVSTSAQLRALDAHSIRVLGIPSLALMETAGRAVAAELLSRFPERSALGVQVLAGRGNNGGDGYVIARLLHLSGVPVKVLGFDGEHSHDAGVERRAAQAVGVPIDTHGGIDAGVGVLVDALFGTGLSRPVQGEPLRRIEAMVSSGLPVVAVDLPSGLCGDTGRVLGGAAPAALTVSFGRARLGCFLEPGAELVGELVVADIGLTGPVPHAAQIVDSPWVMSQLPPRPASGHKGRMGHLGVVAGSLNQAGAAVLVSAAAMRSGCGLVTLLIDPLAIPRLHGLPPEVMVRPLAAPTPEQLDGYDALAVGPGFGTEQSRRGVLRRIWNKARPAAVFDADGLTALEGALSAPVAPRCITPHPGEAGRLLGISARQVQKDRLAALRGLGQVAPTLLKGRNTLISGDPVTINPTGDARLATAGSGDVLTGLVGALLARGVAPAPALVSGAWLHGVAGQLAGAAPLVASDIVAALPDAIRGEAGRRVGPIHRPLV